MFTILVDPIEPIDYWYTAWKRPIENKIKIRYKNKRTKEKKIKCILMMYIYYIM